MSDALPTYGIDKEIKNKLASKLTNEQIADAKQWVEAVLERELPVLDQPNLKDGSVLVELLNKVTGSKVKVQRSELPFKQMENINAFLKGAEKIGCPTFDLFQTVDLYENKNFPQVDYACGQLGVSQVIQCLFSFARHAHKAGCSVPQLGPKIVDKNERYTLACLCKLLLARPHFYEVTFRTRYLTRARTYLRSNPRGSLEVHRKPGIYLAFRGKSSIRVLALALLRTFQLP